MIKKKSLCIDATYCIDNKGTYTICCMHSVNKQLHILCILQYTI